MKQIQRRDRYRRRQLDWNDALLGIRFQLQSQDQPAKDGLNYSSPRSDPGDRWLLLKPCEIGRIKIDLYNTFPKIYRQQIDIIPSNLSAD